MQYELKIPDIGSDEAVSVVNILIKTGDKITKDQTVLELENDKASMEVPADCDGKVEEIMLQPGDKVRTGDLIAILQITSEGKEEKIDKNSAKSEVNENSSEISPFYLPDLGTSDEVNIVEINLTKGQKIEIGEIMLTLESDKASMEVPSEVSGVIISVDLKLGDKVKSHDLIGQIMLANGKSDSDESIKTENISKSPSEDISQTKAAIEPQQIDISSNIDEEAFAKAYASPSVRKFARELGADLGKISGTGRKGRIIDSDVKSWVKNQLQHKHFDNTAIMFASSNNGIPSVPKVDFAKYGEIEIKELSRINCLTGEAMVRSWLNVPMVTQFDKCDITDLEDFRQSIKAEAEKSGVRVSLLPFIVKAVCRAIYEFPRFNSSLSEDAKSLIYKKYFHVGIAVDTPDGLVVPVLRDANKKGIFEIAAELAELGKKARDGKLKPNDFGGASITISSLGGIGGEYFTPIVNTPEAAILGVSKSKIEAIWDGKQFNPRLMLPLSLSYDHRIIDGALGAKMMVFLGKTLQDMRRVLL